MSTDKEMRQAYVTEANPNFIATAGSLFTRLFTWGRTDNQNQVDEAQLPPSQNDQSVPSRPIESPSDYQHQYDKISPPRKITFPVPGGATARDLASGLPREHSVGESTNNGRGCNTPHPGSVPDKSTSVGALDSNGSKTRELSIPLPSFDDYKLETDFYDGYVVHTTHKWELSKRLWEKSIWYQGEEVGSGAFGSVWIQKKQEGGELRAVKVLPRGSLPRGGFSQELLALIKLKDYDHLFTKFLGWYESIDKIFIAMEYVGYGDLGEYILRDPQKAKADAKWVTSQILEGLEVLHKKSICHRDIKPQNILIAYPDPIWIKITDFGVAKRTKNTTARTGWGTDGYRAPEQLGVLPPSLKTKKFPAALDIWSLGCLLHEILTSQKPFTVINEEYDSDIISGILPGSPSSLSEREIDIGLLYEYCQGHTDFPSEDLEKSQVSKEGIAFVKGLLTPSPKDRPTAISALGNPWLKGHVNDWFENLKNEFSLLGVNLDLRGGEKDISMRQLYKLDISRYLSSATNKDVDISSLILEAMMKGYNSALTTLLRSPNRESIGSLARGRLFKLAGEEAEAGRSDKIKLLLHNRVDFCARVDNQSTTVLQWAVKVRYVNTVSIILRSKADISSSTDCLEAFRLATKLGYVDVVRMFLGNRIDVDVRFGECGDHEQYDTEMELVYCERCSWNSNTPLQIAAGGGHIDTVKLLLDNGANVNADAANDYGRTALQAAAGGGYIDIVELLLENNANVNAEPSTPGRTALQAAAGNGNMDIVKLLLDNGANVNADAVTINGRTALQAAAEGRNINIVKLLLDNKAEVNAKAEFMYGLTALQAAARGGNIDIVKLLLDNNAEVNAEGSEVGGQTALQAAAGGGHIDVVKLLLGNKAKVNAEASEVDGQTALQAAAGGGNIDIVKLLLDKNSNVNAKGSQTSGQTALQAAARGGNIDIVRLLLDNKAEVNAEASEVNGQTALQAAARGGHIDIVKLLLDNKAEVNAEAPNFTGRTALQAAAGSGHIGIVKLLLDNKANVNAESPDTSGQTALQVAAGSGHIDIVKLLLGKNANVNATPRHSGLTALQAAAKGGYIDIVKLLLENSADVNAKRSAYWGQTALQAAASGGHIDILKLLLDRGANLNTPTGGETSWGAQTALEAAVIGGHSDIVKLLLDNKADANSTVVGKNTNTALQAAAIGGYTDIAKILLDKNTDVNAIVVGTTNEALKLALQRGNIAVAKIIERARDLASLEAS